MLRVHGTPNHADAALAPSCYARTNEKGVAGVLQWDEGRKRLEDEIRTRRER